MPQYTFSDHDSAVHALAAQVSHFHDAQTPFRINHGSTNSTRRRDPATPQLYIAHLNHILDINVEAGFAFVEPNLPLDGLVVETLKVGLVPPVVMEFPGITVGGGFSGASGESSGWSEGLFDCTVEEVEVILGNGEVVYAMKGGVNGDLFNAARCSLGTMGVVTLLKVRLTKAEDAVQLTYHHTPSVKGTIDKLAELCARENADFDFIEGILYNQDKGVIITGRRVSSSSATVSNLPHQRFDRAVDPWFYMHAEETSPLHAELVPTQSYLFRHDRGAFWSGDVFLQYYGLPNNRLVRWVFNGLLTARATYKAMLATDTADGAVIQDLLLPVETSEAFVHYVATELQIWPLWICPIRKKAGEGRVVAWPFYNTGVKSDLTLNFGVWGPTDPSPRAVCKTNRDLEQKLRELRGTKVPYAANFYTEDEFWELYDREEYDTLRKKWHAEALPSMYEKVRRKHDQEKAEQEWEQDLTWTDRFLMTWPLGGLYQTFCVLFR